MKAAEGRAGRVFVLRLDAGEALPDCVERFAAEHGILAAHVTVTTRIGKDAAAVGRVAAGMLALGGQGQATLTLAGDLGERDVAAADESVRPRPVDVTREVVIQEWLGLQVLRVDDPDAGVDMIDPSMRAPGQTMVLRQTMLDQALIRAAKCAPAPVPPAPMAAAPTPEPPAPPPSGPATVAVYLLNAGLN